MGTSSFLPIRSVVGVVGDDDDMVVMVGRRRSLWRIENELGRTMTMASLCNGSLQLGVFFPPKQHTITKDRRNFFL